MSPSIAYPITKLPADLFPKTFQEIQDRKTELASLKDPLNRARASKFAASIGLIVGMIAGLTILICIHPSIHIVFFGTLGAGAAGSLIAIPIPQLIIQRKINQLEKESINDNTSLNNDQLFALFQEQNVFITVEDYNKRMRNFTQVKYFNLPAMRED